MLEQLNDWAPLLTILVSLGGLQLGLYLGLRTDLRGLGERVDNLTGGLAEVRERLASLETRVGHIEARLPTSPTN
ncbi:MAG: hypothetical protein OXE97_04630 [Gammaproteobacteria bacterium]|nr:hypothetical protein [Gammaproteobacteria bacterium]MCY4210327.1 hypothetical protein [Gammaproteobacteria bacterium]